MKDIHLYNCQVFEKISKLTMVSGLSSPLLVSSKINVPKKFMYIGQETNTWVNNNKTNADVDDIEDTYYHFLKDGSVNSEYWRFITDVANIEMNDIIDNILWCNCLIAGKKETLGTPIINNELKNISVEYLTNMYQIYEPEIIIVTCGPTNPYYEIITRFFNNIGIEFTDYPKINDKVCLKEEKVFWTYHPNYLNMKHKSSYVKTFIKENM